MPKAVCLAFVLWVIVFLFLSDPAAALAGREGMARKEGYLEILSRIYKEVKELGPYPGQDFIRWDFFMGEGDDDTNKPVHAVILIQDGKQGERMTLLVSRMERRPGDPQVFLNRETREISCLVRDEKAEFVSSAYTTEDLERLLSGLLLAIKDKKKLLRGFF